MHVITPDDIKGTPMIDTSIFQTTPAPQDLLTLQWIIITVLGSAVLYLFRQNSKRDEKCSEFQVEILEKSLTGLSEASEAIRNLTDVVEAMQGQAALREEFVRLREEFHEHNKK